MSDDSAWDADIGLAVPLPPDPLGAEESAVVGSVLKRRAVVGAFVVVLRGIGIRVLGTAGYLVLASLLSPAELGVVAFGLALTFATKFMTDAGLGTALIRRTEAPTRAAYEVALGLQLAGTLLIGCVTVIWWAAAQSEVALVTLLFVLGLPLVAFRTPNLVALDRQLEFRPTAYGEVIEVCVYNAVAVAAVLLGAGPAGLGLAAIVKTAVGTWVINRLGPMGWLRPRLSITIAKEILPFGVKVSANGAVLIGRDQGLNVIIAGIAGYGGLGLWTIANRILTIPLLLFESLWRVSLPAMVQVRATRNDAGDVMMRSVSLGSVLGMLVIVPVAIMAGPAMSILLGDEWTDAGAVVPWLCVGIGISAPLGAAAIGYLYAEDAAGSVLRCAVIASAAMLVSSSVLLLLVGYVGAGIGWAMGSILGAALLARAVRLRSNVNLLIPIGRPTLAGVLAAAVGQLVLTSLNEDLIGLVAAGVAATIGYAAIVAVLDGPAFKRAVDTLSTVRKA